MNKITTRIGTIGAFGAAAALAIVAIAAPAQASELDYTETSTSTSTSSSDSYQATLDGLTDILNGTLAGNTGNGALGNDVSLVEGGLINAPLVDVPVEIPVDDVGSGNSVGNGNDVPVGSGNDVPVGSGNDTSVDAPVDVPVDVPVEAPIEAPVNAPVDAPVGNGNDSTVGGSSVDGIDTQVDNLVDDVLGGLGLGLGD
jgi:hypothetical protein